MAPLSFGAGRGQNEFRKCKGRFLNTIRLCNWTDASSTPHPHMHIFRLHVIPTTTRSIREQARFVIHFLRPALSLDVETPIEHA